MDPELVKAIYGLGLPAKVGLGVGLFAALGLPIFNFLRNAYSEQSGSYEDTTALQNNHSSQQIRWGSIERDNSNHTTIAMFCLGGSFLSAVGAILNSDGTNAVIANLLAGTSTSLMVLGINEIRLKMKQTWHNKVYD